MFHKTGGFMETVGFIKTGFIEIGVFIKIGFRKRGFNETGGLIKQSS